jgi:hypothetical protein
MQPPHKSAQQHGLASNQAIGRIISMFVISSKKTTRLMKVLPTFWHQPLKPPLNCGTM